MNRQEIESTLANLTNIRQLLEIHEAREIDTRLVQLQSALLKWQHLDYYRTQTSALEIESMRRDILQRLSQLPVLRAHIGDPASTRIRWLNAVSPLIELIPTLVDQEHQWPLERLLDLGDLPDPL
jgi:Domain of unknown function DUF29